MPPADLARFNALGCFDLLYRISQRAPILFSLIRYNGSLLYMAAFWRVAEIPILKNYLRQLFYAFIHSFIHAFSETYRLFSTAPALIRWAITNRRPPCQYIDIRLEIIQ
jgi:hypothetical protein